MTPQERLAAALNAAWAAEAEPEEGPYAFEPDGVVGSLFRLDPSLAQDIADGEALRLLREALPTDQHVVRISGPWRDTWDVSVEDTDLINRRYIAADASGPVLAEAADACLARLVKP